MKLEKDLLVRIKKRLELYSLTGEVEFFLRINAGKVRTYYGSYVQLASPGTPDYIAIIRNKQENLTVLFIEAKSSAGKLRMEQRKFKEKYEKRCGFLVSTIREIFELDYIIENISKDFTKELPNEL